jgi:hypothetical protein
MAGTDIVELAGWRIEGRDEERHEHARGVVKNERAVTHFWREFSSSRRPAGPC